MASHDIIYKIMNFLNIIVKSLKTTLLLFRKVAMAKKYGGKVKIIEEGISSFYEKIKQNNIKSVDILSQSIVYKDLS
jgi:ABC-type phosphate/phosphonate transport system ATPase subunit